MQRPLADTPTLAQVARMAGVSVPTASRVANGREHVAPATRVRVEEVMRRTGYRPRPRASETLATPLLDLVVPHLDSPWTGEMLRGAEQAAADRGLGVVVSGQRGGAAAGPGMRPPSGWLDRVRERGTSGVLFGLAELTAAQYMWLTRNGVPYVFVDPGTEPPAGVPAVGAANRDGGRQATEHLLALGHRRIAVLGGHPHTLCSRARVDGYRSAMAAAGVRHRPEFVRHANFDTGLAERTTHELLGLTVPPTAIFAASDQMAAGVLRAAVRRGLRVPSELSVVGFDDIAASHWPLPGLTTVRQPIADMSAQGVRMLARMARGMPPEDIRVELPTQLVVRSTTARPLR
ncbi:LacI family DNA-binding transcriptional regulator [Streptomyces sp. NPDC058464]|uniref:LacI family DNA-binding transcriptional regulator n=1 Tax=Streptomyces sp. NPDC058464 TaxID=3346511 RepID=UPI003647DB35